jgi:hypothetical protein
VSLEDESTLCMVRRDQGKSALYSLLRQKKDTLRDQDIFMAGGESIRGAPVFEALVADPPASEEQFRRLWKSYVLSLLGTIVRVADFQTQNAKQLMAMLEKMGLIVKEWSLKQSLRAAMDFIRRLELSGEVKISPVTGQAEGIAGKVRMGDSVAADGTREPQITPDVALEQADKTLSETV